MNEIIALGLIGVFLVVIILFGVMFISVFDKVTMTLALASSQGPVYGKINQVGDAVATLLESQSSHASMMFGGSPHTYYMSNDGKYKADSIEELLDIMAKDGALKLNSEEYKKLKDFFETTTKAIGDVDIPDWDDDFDPDDWQHR